MTLTYLLLRTYNTVLYTDNVHKEIRKAVDEAERAGLIWRDLHSHTIGWVECRCGRHIKVFSSGKNPEEGAKRIRHFITKHRNHTQESSS